MKVCLGLQLERVLITLLSKTVCCRVTWFQLEKYWLVHCNVRECWPKCTPTSQKFWKLTNNGLKWCNFKMYVIGSLSIIKHNFGEYWKNLSFLFSDLQCYAITILFCDLIAKLRSKIKIITYNPVYKLLNYLLDLCGLAEWR